MLLFFQYDYLLSLIFVLLRCRTCHHGDDDDDDDDDDADDDDDDADDADDADAGDDADDADAGDGGGRLSSAILETQIYTPRDTTCGFQPWFHLRPWDTHWGPACH